MAKIAQVRTRKRGRTFSYIFEAAGMAAYIDFLHGNIGITSESVTLKDFMANWLDNVMSGNIKASTMQTYKSFFAKQIVPHLGGIKLQDLTPAMLDNWLRKLLQKGLAKNTISAMHAFIHNALNYAVPPAQLIQSNPAMYIKVPKNAPRNVIKRHIITPERFAALLEKHQISYKVGCGYYFQTPKNDSSKRYIIVDEYLLNELHRWQVRQIANEDELGGRYAYIYFEEDGHLAVQSKVEPLSDLTKASLVCTQNDGQRVFKNALTSMLSKEGLKAHSFRHTHTTVLTENGAPAKAIAGRLGHANVQITQNLYAHNTLKLQEEAAAIFTKSLQTNA